MNSETAPQPGKASRRAEGPTAGPGKISSWIRRMLGRIGAANHAQGFLPPVPGEDPPRAIDEHFSSEMFVQLLLELPLHRSEIAESWRLADLQRLRGCVHRLLGATVYCNAPELEAALRELRHALHTGDASGIALQHARTLAVIDTTLSGSGCR